MGEYIYNTNKIVTSPMQGFTGEVIIRCKNCKYGYQYNWSTESKIPSDYLDCHGKLVTKWDYHNDKPQHTPVEPNGFCKWGVPKSKQFYTFRG